MKRVFLALVVMCSAVFGTVTVNGQRGLPACDPDNGGIKLPAGFCALVVHKGVGVNARHLLVMPNGDVFVSVRATGPTPGAILGLRDTNGNGKFDDPGDLMERFGTGSHGLVYRNGYLYYATPTTIERFKMNPGELKPAGPAEVVRQLLPVVPRLRLDHGLEVRLHGVLLVCLSCEFDTALLRRPGTWEQLPIPAKAAASTAWAHS